MTLENLSPQCNRQIKGYKQVLEPACILPGLDSNNANLPLRYYRPSSQPVQCQLTVEFCRLMEVPQLHIFIGLVGLFCLPRS
jgi:hypothetical protein